jgi:hypothetical protein
MPLTYTRGPIISPVALHRRGYGNADDPSFTSPRQTMYQILLLHDLELLTYSVSPAPYNNNEVALQGFRRLSQNHTTIVIMRGPRTVRHKGR